MNILPKGRKCMRLRFCHEIQSKEEQDGKEYLINVIRNLSLYPTRILKELPSDCLNELFASWVHSVYRMSIESGFSVAESIEKALNNRVILELFDETTQINLAREEAEKRKVVSKGIKNLDLSKAVS